MNSIFDRLERANLIDAFYLATSMERLPSGLHILEGLSIEKDDQPVHYQHIAGDGTGGAFVLLQNAGVAHVSSEGGAAIVGESLNDAISNTLEIGCWIGALRFMEDPNKQDARTAWDQWRREWGVPNGPEDEETAKAIRHLLGLSKPDEPFKNLYDTVASSTAYTFRTSDGDFVILGY